MNLLLDTHTLLWFFSGDKELSAKARKAIESENALNYVSVATLLEIAIKVSLKKLTVKHGFRHIGTLIEENGFVLLPINFEHSVVLSGLEFHHRDPFDRMLVSQSLVENISIVTKDPVIKKYGVSTVW